MILAPHRQNDLLIIYDLVVLPELHQWMCTFSVENVYYMMYVAWLGSLYIIHKR